jgi:hypothetical protein
MRARDAGRTAAIIVLLAVVVGACGSEAGGGGDGQGGATGQGDPAGTGNGQGQDPGRQSRSVVAVRPNAPFDPSTPFDREPDGGRDLPDPVFFDTSGRCFADLRAGSYDALATRMTSVIESAGPGTDRRLLAVAYTCRGVALLNKGALLEATRDLDQAEGRLGELPEDPRHQLDLLLLRGQMVASAERQQRQRADRYLVRAVELAPDQAGGLRRELRAAAADPTATTTTGSAEPTSTGGTETPGAATDTSAGQPSTSGPASVPTSPPAPSTSIG